MITGQSYKEFIEEQGQIEKNIAQGWGYQINPKEFLPSIQKIQNNIKVASITPLKKVFDIPISHQLQKVQEELLMLQNQRKLNQLTQKAQQINSQSQHVQDSAAIKMMRQCIQQYNFIIDHRHIKQKNTEKARKILGIQKSQSKQLFQQIHSLKQQLGSSTLSNTIKINNEIAKLYKRYSQIIPKSNNSERMTTQHNKSSVNHAYTSANSILNSQTNFGTSKISPNKKTTTVNRNNSSEKSEYRDSQTKKDSHIQLKDLVIMQQLNQSQQGSSLQSSRRIQQELRFEPQSLLIHHAMKMQRRISEYVPKRRFLTLADIKQKQKEEKKERMATTIEQAYQKKEILNKGKKLDKVLQQHHDVAQVWKQRITQNTEKYRDYQLKMQPKMRAKKFISVKNTRRGTIQNDEKEVKQIKVNFKVYDKAQQIKQDLVQKERILSNILRKKQSKYKRIPGTQIMQKNDVNSTAKVFLGISKKDQNSKKKVQNNEKSIANINPNTPEWQNMQKDDQKLYWSMCKNERLNLLLKNRKQQ